MTNSHQITTYGELDLALKDLPFVWYAGLLQTIVREGYKKDSFQRYDGASNFVKLVEQRIETQRKKEQERIQKKHKESSDANN